MPATHIQAVPKQSAKVYRLLNDSGELTARQIAEKLKIFPNTVYRSVKPLIDLGMVEQSDTYPVSYKASPSSDAMNWYLRAAVQSFRQDFGAPKPKTVDDSTPSITFIKDRKSMLAIGEQEARRAKKTINYIVSGHRIPNSSVLAYRKASTTGVRVRAIVQNTPDTTDNSLERYDEMGVEVRYLPNIGIRLFVFDDRTVMLTSYDDTKSSKAFGIRFIYPPVARQLNELFEQRWAQATPLN